MRPFLIAFAAMAAVVFSSPSHAQWNVPGWAVMSPDYHPQRAARHHHRYKLRRRIAHRHHAASIAARRSPERATNIPPTIEKSVKEVMPLERRNRHDPGQPNIRETQPPHPAAGPDGGAIGNHVCAGGHCATVASFLVAPFQAIISAFQQLGYAIGSPGCLSSGHMRNSLHHWGGACDLFDQVARDRTRLPMPPPHVQITVARQHGLISGCEWRHRDCGHFQVASVGRHLDRLTTP
jgi:hypothetical protein